MTQQNDGPYLSCPVCGEECKSLPANRANPQFPSGYWNDGDTCECQCGASLRVEADGECAWLEKDECE